MCSALSPCTKGLEIDFRASGSVQWIMDGGKGNGWKFMFNYLLISIVLFCSADETTFSGQYFICC